MSASLCEALHAESQAYRTPFARAYSLGLLTGTVLVRLGFAAGQLGQKKGGIRSYEHRLAVLR